MRGGLRAASPTTVGGCSARFEGVEGRRGGESGGRLGGGGGGVDISVELWLV